MLGIIIGMLLPSCRAQKQTINTSTEQIQDTIPKKKNEIKKDTISINQDTVLPQIEIQESDRIMCLYGLPPAMFKQIEKEDK